MFNEKNEVVEIFSHVCFQMFIYELTCEFQVNKRDKFQLSFSRETVYKSMSSIYDSLSYFYAINNTKRDVLNAI